MSSIPYDLGLMILERVKPSDLKEVSRVNHEWRDTISENRHRMRLFPIDWISIDYSDPMKIYAYPYRGWSYENCPPAPYYPHSQIPSLDGILKYETLKLEIKHKNDYEWCKIISTEDLSKIMSFMEALPDWWFKKLNEVRLQVCGSFPSVTLCSRFPHLQKMFIKRNWITCGNTTALSLVNDLIRGAPRVDLFVFEIDFGRRLKFGNDTILETIMRKSWIHPTTTPSFPPMWLKPTFSLSQIIRFLELTTFIPMDDSHRFAFGHRWNLSQSVEGRLEDWNEWLRRNTIHIPLPDEVTDDPKHRRFFLFRGHKFSVYMNSLAD